ncbi:hypothetical protein OTK49_20920 [Vibrio coralliirubri]|uniref:hypothetical protein n=1 Tax=Vibrio coralliirubri TaxID=1516159 RepID=UPI0022847F6F|nr:hypothetical protein [Vibrio coralliirubri]MCY9864982.1 hypothetical protein [Vibrio coralliirubri]
MQEKNIQQLSEELAQTYKYQCLLAMSLYKKLCEAQDAEMVRLGATEKDLESLNEDDPDVVHYLQSKLGYFISFTNSFRGWVFKDLDHNFDVADVRDATHAFDRLATITAQDEFGSSVSKLRDTLKELGQTSQAQSRELSRIMWALLKE